MRHVVVEPPSLRAGDWRYWPELGQCQRQNQWTASTKGQSKNMDCRTRLGSSVDTGPESACDCAGTSSVESSAYAVNWKSGLSPCCSTTAP